MTDEEAGVTEAYLDIGFSWLRQADESGYGWPEPLCIAIGRLLAERDADRERAEHFKEMARANDMDREKAENERDAFQDGMAREAAERYRLNRAMVALANGGFASHDPAQYREWATRVLSDTTLYREG